MNFDSMKRGLMIKWVWIAGISVICLGCRERIFLDTNPQDFQLISINGLIDNSPGPYYVEVQETRDADRPPVPVDIAEVMLVDGSGNRETCIYEENGRYACPGQVVTGTPGEAYYVQVQIGGDVYTSIPETMPPVMLGTNRLEWEETAIPSTTSTGIDIEKVVLDFDMYAELPEVTEPIFLQWQFLETFQIRPTDFPDPFGSIPPPCFITQNAGVQNFYFLSLNEFSNSSLFLESVIQRDIDISFLVKHIFSIRQSSVSENYANYLEQVRTLTEATGSLFDAPAGRVVGNMEHEGTGLSAVGYFAAVASDTTHSVIYREEIESNIVDLCLFDVTKFEYPRICLDCLEIPKSTYEEPYWWSRVR